MFKLRIETLQMISIKIELVYCNCVEHFKQIVYKLLNPYKYVKDINKNGIKKYSVI